MVKCNTMAHFPLCCLSNILFNIMNYPQHSTQNPQDWWWIIPKDVTKKSVPSGYNLSWTSLNVIIRNYYHIHSEGILPKELYNELFFPYLFYIYINIMAQQPRKLVMYLIKPRKSQKDILCFSIYNFISPVSISCLPRISVSVNIYGTNSHSVSRQVENQSTTFTGTE